MYRRHPLPSRQRGAALLLLLVLASLGAASLMMSAFTGERGEPMRARYTHTALGEAREALLGFAITHGRLPRPAISALDGRENPAPCTAAAECTGFLPWVALGIPPDDGWGHRLRYSVSQVFTQEPVLSKSAIADKTLIGRNSNGPYYRLGQANCTVPAPCAPAVIFSTGKSAPGTSAQGIVQFNASRSNTDEQHNDAGFNEFVTRPASLDPTQPGGEFDDLVVWLPLRQLYLRMNVAGVLP